MRGVIVRAAALLLAPIAAGHAPASAIAADPVQLVRAAIRLPCQAAPGTALAGLAAQLPGARTKRAWVRHSRDDILGRRLVLDVGGDEMIVEFSGEIGRPDYVAVRYLTDPSKRPLLLAIADHGCTIHTARRVTHDAAGRPGSLQDLDSRLRPVGEPEPLNPRVPTGEDPPGVPIGLVDSGVNYLLPEIASRLARDSTGEILGYDYWDLDRRPFDVLPTPDPFFPSHHGTRTAGLLLDQAPVAKVVPYRYPRPEMARMRALIEDAAAHGVRVINLSLVSHDRNEWLPFREAAEAHREILFVVAAGNSGRNIDDRPIYPAAFDLANMIVVTSATADGRLKQGVNWGPTAVDLMAHSDEIEVLDFDGKRRFVSGSSYATARVSALAACLLAGHPEWTTARLKAAIVQEAEAAGSGQVAEGFIPDSAFGPCAPDELSVY